MGAGSFFGQQIAKKAMKQTRITASRSANATSRALGQVGYKGSGYRSSVVRSAQGPRRGAVRSTFKRNADDYYSGIVVHGSPTKGLTQIDPRMSSATKAAGYTDRPSVFLWNPTAQGMDAPFSVGMAAQEYAAGGSIYIGRVTNAKKVADGPGSILTSRRSVQVLDEIDPNDLTAVDNALEKYGLKRFRPVQNIDTGPSVV